jgi:hypothetical protein
MSIPSTLTLCDLRVAAARLRVDVAVIQALTEVESLGGGFLSDGQIKILYERHIMYRQLATVISAEQLHRFHNTYPNLVNPLAGGYATGATPLERGQGEHLRLKAARFIDKSLSLEACSWGMFQIMGFHWRNLGYESAVDFVLTLSKSEANQLEAFCRFVEHNTQLLNALRSHDWTQVARLYNGKNFAKNKYDIRLRDSHKKWSQQH